ncbi:MAG: 2-C-methyl-D-erythritol 4-phosphate cytidylyltransferase [Chthonomonas sp.]|nr:2-C-methyl-D-erythritol 4-phosphate cytidylyltransferase [Chthonomonas sp.]
MKVAAIILCGGSGTRFGGDKLIEPLGGKPVWKWSIDAFREVVDLLIVVDNGRGIASSEATVVSGGATRSESVRAGLEAVPEGYEFVLIHDGARPLVTPDLIRAVLVGAQEHGAATAAVAMADTLRQKDGVTVDRNQVFAIQTPQCARLSDLHRAHAGEVEATDDAALLQKIGINVAYVSGNRINMKITSPEDMEIARALVGSAVEIRTGFGYDVHAFSADPSRPMMLGGVKFDGPALDGHSDADALLHAVVDALLGAGGLGDIGVHYPPSDPQWKNCPSIRFVEETGQRLVAQGWTIENVDATLLAETPKIMSRSNEIREVIANALGIDPTRVNVKATTNEGLGAIGRKEGIAAMAVATLRRSP